MPRVARLRALALTLAGTCGLALTVQLLPASAAPDIPSAKQVQQAQQTAAAKAGQVQGIEAQLSAASAELDRLQVASQLAGQAYNAAVEKLEKAKAAAAKAAAANRAAQLKVVQARVEVGQLARTQIQSSGPLVDLASSLSAAGPQQLIDQLGSFGSTSTVLQGKLTRLQALEQAAKLAKQKADATAAAVQQATDAAEQARKAAEAAATAQQRAVAGYAARRTELIAELAKAQQVSVAVARQRQEGLEAIARAKAAAKRRAEAKAQAERERLASQREAAAREARRAQQERERAQQPTRTKKSQATKKSQHRSGGSSGGSTDRSNSSPVSTPTGGGGYHAGAAQRAIAFARAQVGEPYVFGATGPNTWDCSGLTMRAYEQSGYEIGHFTGTQWGNVQHISKSALRPGDLLFWGDGSNPSSIYHTALYLGGGMMVQAPRPGRNVEIVSMYYWVAPNLFGRV